MVKNLLIFLIILTSLNSRGQDATPISKGEPAPFSGILFTERLANDIRKEVIQGEINKVYLEGERGKHKLSMEIVKLKDVELDLYKEQNKKLVKQNDSNESMKLIYFGLGILVTGAAVYGAGALAR